MNKSIFGVVGFVLGAAAGSLVTWKLIEQKYMDMADDEIRSVKEMYARKRCVDTNKSDDAPASNEVRSFNEDELRRVVELVTPYMEAPTDDKPDYTAYSQAKQPETKDASKTDIPSEKPYIISPNEFDEIGYTISELTYYSGNGVLVDEDGEPIEDPERTVGTDFSNHFGEYEDDAVFVRNDRLMSDYQILLDRGAY